MVSGFFTSPCDHDRILSGDASEMRMALKLSGFFGFSNRLNRSSIIETVPPAGPAVSPLGWLLEQLDVERQALEFLDHHVERLGQAGLEHVLALHDGFVHARA